MKEYFSFVKQYKKEIESKNPFLYNLPGIISSVFGLGGILMYQILCLLKYSFAHTVLEVAVLIEMVLLFYPLLFHQIKGTIKYIQLKKGQK